MLVLRGRLFLTVAALLVASTSHARHTQDTNSQTNSPKPNAKPSIFSSKYVSAVTPTCKEGAQDKRLGTQEVGTQAPAGDKDTARKGK